MASDEKKVERETWTNKLDFLLACIGFSVGLGNVWRFPYLCYKNGGGAFLIPYFICVAVGGIPLFFLEISVGQFMSEGGINAWRLCPILQGIGWTTTFIIFLVNCYYNIILAWGFYYLFASFTKKLPWDSCDNYWNTEHCTLNFTRADNVSLDGHNVSGINATSNETRLQIDPTTEFWEHKVLGISDGIDEQGTIKWDLALCLILAWLVIYLCICKGIKSSGKVVYFTATAPYVFMLILLIRGCTLPGAIDGILFYLVPDFKELAKMQVWVDAGTQIFFSYAISLGGLTALGSYNKFNHNSYKDAIIFSLTNSGTSVFAGFVIFSTLGYMAHVQGTTVDKVAESGPGLAFIVYPKAVSAMPIAPLWSALFFFMILLLGMDSQFVGVEGLATAFLDCFPTLRRKGIREAFIAFLVIIQCLVGLSMVTNGGMYIFQLFDYYAGSRIVVLVALFEIIAICYIYGIDRFYDNIEMMFGFRINPYMKVCWVFLTPVFCLSIFIMSTISYSELDYKRPMGTYTYPSWAIAIGWTIACVPITMIPFYAVYKAIVYRLANKPLSDMFRPEDLKPHQLRPQDKLHPQEVMKMAENGEELPAYREPMVPDDPAPPYSQLEKNIDQTVRM